MVTAPPTSSGDLVVARPEGLYCPPGDFYIDPWRPVDRAVITHAHSDHARVGHGHYLAHTDSEGTLRTRLGEHRPADACPTARRSCMNGVRISLHPAGHVLGSAQVRLEHGGRVWVASGDYKTEPDGTCTPFEPVPCDTFITESTFGLPIYRWPTQAALFAEINDWWRRQRRTGPGVGAVLLCLRQGAAASCTASIRPSGRSWCHGAVEPLNAAYRAAGVALPPTVRVTDPGVKAALLSARWCWRRRRRQGTPWMRRFGDYCDAFACGWMQLRGTRRRRSVDRGFVLSDHADWPGLLQAIAGTGAERVLVTHGSVAVLVRWLPRTGLDAQGFKTEYGDEDDRGRSRQQAHESTSPRSIAELDATTSSHRQARSAAALSSATRRAGRGLGRRTFSPAASRASRCPPRLLRQLAPRGARACPSGCSTNAIRRSAISRRPSPLLLPAPTRQARPRASRSGSRQRLLPLRGAGRRAELRERCALLGRAALPRERFLLSS